MHIAIDTSLLSSGHQDRGSGVYVKELVEALKTYEPEHTYQLITEKETDCQHADVIHYPYFDPFFLTLPLVKRKPTVVTVHDLIPLVFPKQFPAGIRGSIKWQIQKASLRGAARVITDSDASKQDIQKIAGLSGERIDTIYLAPSSVYQPVADTKVLTALRKKYHLPKNFILYVGDVNWNKNIPGLLCACAKSAASLVCVGRAFLNDALPEMKEINRMLQKLHLKDRVLKLGYVPEEELAGLYSMADCLIQPSFYEGFGLPVLEAFACGCPVVAADNSSLSEIAGPAIRVSANNPQDIADGIGSILALSLTERKALAEKGNDWVRQFSWERVAHETVAAYERSVR